MSSQISASRPPAMAEVHITKYALETGLSVLRAHRVVFAGLIESYAKIHGQNNPWVLSQKDELAALWALEDALWCASSQKGLNHA
jgi:hypothetical protein